MNCKSTTVGYCPKPATVMVRVKGVRGWKAPMCESCHAEFATYQGVRGHIVIDKVIPFSPIEELKGSHGGR